MDHDKCIALIKLYRSKEPLWNVNSPYYRTKNVRERLWRDISDEMKMPLHLLKRKMTILLASYRSERYRIKKSRRSNIVYESKWFAFNEFDFMADKSSTNNTVDTLPDTEYATSYNTDTTGFDSHDTNTDVAAEETRLQKPAEASVARSSTRPTPGGSGATGHSHTLLREVFDVVKSSAVASTDSYVTFGQHIANELRKYDPTTLAQVKHAINNVIFQADMGRYSNGYRRVESAAGTPILGSVISAAPSMFLAKQENEENEALEGASIQDTPVYFS